MKAIFLNGVFESVLEEILTATSNDPDLICYLQPYKSSEIKLLKEETPSENNSTKLYISTTSNLNLISYCADIVFWEDKREIADSRLLELKNHIQQYQPNEGSIYIDRGDKDKPCINLISIRNLIRLENPFSVEKLIKISDKTPCKKRTQAGGWSYVEELPSWLEIQKSTLHEKLISDLENGISKSLKDSSQIRNERLKKAAKHPEKIQSTSVTYIRNPDVIAAVLERASGKCEYCKNDAPFIRQKDNTPYLEVHHKDRLADGGEDTVNNAVALCPNCHRQAHFG